MEKEKKKKAKKAGLNWSEFKTTLLVAMVTLLLSPISIVIGFKLNNYLASPRLSIEYVLVNEIVTVSNMDDIQGYFTKSNYYKNYRAKNISYLGGLNLITLKEDAKLIQPENLLSTIRKEFSSYINYLNETSKGITNQINGLRNATKSELTVWAIYDLNITTEADGIDQLREILRQEFSKRINEMASEKRDVAKHSKAITESIESIQLKLSILNNGSTDGLVRNDGYISAKGKKYKIIRIPPPIQSETLMAVPTYDVNPGNDTYLSRGVGRIEKNTMAEFWYKVEYSPDSLTALSLAMKGSYTVILSDQDNTNILRLETIKK